MNIFENLTGVSVMDCIIEGGIIYIVVEEGKISLAIGKDGSLIRRVEKVMGKNVKLFEYSSDLLKFVKNLIPQSKNIKIKGSVIEVRVEKKDRPIVIGRGSKNLKIVKKVLERNFNIKEVIIR
jgi:N utilization substance protein A